MLNHGPEVTVEIGWQDLLAGQLVWDRWTAAVDNPVMAFVHDFRLMALATTTDMVLSDDRAELNKRQEKAGGDITANLRQEFDRSGEPFSNDLRIEDISPKLAG